MPSRRARSPANQEQYVHSQGKRVINLIAGGFRAGGERRHAREVYAKQISTVAQLGKRLSPKEDIVISFTEDDLSHVTTQHNEAMVITTEVDRCDMKRILIDRSSLTDILFLDAFEKMGISKRDLKQLNFPLIGFAGRAT